MDWNDFSSVFWKVQHSHSRHQKTTSNLVRLILRGRLKVSNEWSLKGAMALCTLTYDIILGGILHFLFVCVCKFLKILMVLDKTIHKAFRIHKTLKTQPTRKKIFFTIYIHVPKRYLGRFWWSQCVWSSVKSGCLWLEMIVSKLRFCLVVGTIMIAKKDLYLSSVLILFHHMNSLRIFDLWYILCQIKQWPNLAGKITLITESRMDWKWKL